MVGYEIEHLTETVIAKCRHHVAEIRFVAEFRVELAMVDDVIAMSAARSRLQVRRGIDVADAEPRQVGSQRRGVPETEPLVELQAVSRPRDGLPPVSDILVRFGRCSCTAASRVAMVFMISPLALSD